MMDNEYITLRLRQEEKKSMDDPEPKSNNIDMRDCSHLTLLAEHKERDVIKKEFGNIYCSVDIEPDSPFSNIRGLSNENDKTSRMIFEI